MKEKKWGSERMIIVEKNELERIIYKIDVLKHFNGSIVVHFSGMPIIGKFFMYIKYS